MHIVQDVQRNWKRLSAALRRFVNSQAMRSTAATFGLRCKVVRNLARGESPCVIARILGCSESSVYRAAQRFLQAGVEGLHDGRDDNGETKVHETYVAAVLKAVAGSPLEYGYERPTWTQELLILAVQKRTAVVVSTTTMSRLLGSLEVRRGRPKPTVACPWNKPKKTRRLNKIRRLEENLGPNEVLLHLDEVDIHLNPKIGPDYMLRGQQKEVLTPGKNEKRYVAGALNTRTGRLSWVEGERKTSALFIDLVDHLVRHEYASAKTIHIVLDNFRIHSSRAVEAARTRWGDKVKFHFLPPYCPDHNRIERLWKDLHDNVTRNHTCSNMAHLMTRVRNYLKIRRRGQHRYAPTA